MGSGGWPDAIRLVVRDTIRPECEQTAPFVDNHGMGWHRELVQSFRRLIRSPIGELSQAQRSLRYSIDLSRHCARQLKKDRAAQMAAALTFHTLFSLLPTIVLMLVVLASFPGLEDTRLEFRTRLIEILLPPTRQPTPAEDAAEEQTDASAADEGQTADAALEGDDSDKALVVHEARRQLAERVQIYMDQLEKLDFGRIGAVGLLVFIYAATALLATIERSFNMIFGARDSRPWYIRLPMYYTVITLAPIVLMAGQIMQQQFLDILSRGAWTAWLATPMILLSPLVATWLVFFAMFSLLPNAKVKRRAAAVGSLVSALGLVIGQELFAAFVMRAGTATIYGALALLPLLLMWLWLTWLIILFGLELTYTLQTLRGRQFMELQARREAAILGDPMLLVPIMAHIGHAFTQGNSVRAGEIADRLNLPLRSVVQFGQTLEEDGLIHQMQSNGDFDPRYSLSLPPNRIRITQLLALGRSITSDRSEGQPKPGWSVLDRLSKAQQDAAGDMSLQSLLEDGES